MSNILVTGGAGYIGSHVVNELKKSGHRVLVVDNLSEGHREVVCDVLGVEFIYGDIGQLELMESVFKDYNIDSVMHFSAFANVQDSVKNPIVYYNNNVISTLNLLQMMVKHGVGKIIFSSTAATYGTTNCKYIEEDHPQLPINSYGDSKLAIERALKHFERAYGLEYIIFRYFNAAGANPQIPLGENHLQETHLIPLILKSALGKYPTITVYGDDYDTYDGTCIRDYLHVTDIALAHVAGLDLKGSNIFNLGHEKGFSVLEVLNMAVKITGHDIPYKIGDHREGDPPRLVSSAKKAQEVLNWKAKNSSLEQIISDAWEYERIRKL